MDTFKNLSIPEEPKELKRQAQIEHGRQPDMDMDSFVLWFGNKLVSYLWTTYKWKDVLKQNGITWQTFLKIVSFHKKDLIRWARDEKGWDDLIVSIRESLPRLIFHLKKSLKR